MGLLRPRDGTLRRGYGATVTSRVVQAASRIWPQQTRTVANWQRYARAAVLKGDLNVGWCPICEGRTVFVWTDPWLRDHYRCVRCHSIPRWRALIHVIENRFPAWRSGSIHEVAPSGPASRKLAEAADYSSSHFFPGVPLGSTHDGFRCEDLQQLTLPDGSLDLFVSQDVMEHIPRPERAFAEIARVLRPGGAHVFTVPIYGRPETLVRVEPDETGNVRLLMEADYHGNPVSDEGSLVIREWGADIVNFVREHSGLETEVIELHDRFRGLDGEFLQVLVSRKP